MACEAVCGHVSRGCPTNVQLEICLGTLWLWKSRDSAKLQVILDNTCTMGSCIVVLKDDCIPMPTGVEHNDMLNGIVSVVEPSHRSLADVEFGPSSQW